MPISNTIFPQGGGGGGGTATWGDITGDINSQTDLQTEFALYAPLASPAFTGNPTAPTQVSTDSSTKLATTAYVTTAVPTPSSDLPLMDGIASAGTSTTYSRKDHIHPTDTTKYPYVQVSTINIDNENTTRLVYSNGNTTFTGTLPSDITSSSVWAVQTYYASASSGAVQTLFSTVSNTSALSFVRYRTAANWSQWSVMGDTRLRYVINTATSLGHNETTRGAIVFTPNSAITVTLINPDVNNVGKGFYCFSTGAGNVTLQVSGTSRFVNGATTCLIGTGISAYVSWDGVNWQTSFSTCYSGFTAGSPHRLLSQPSSRLGQVWKNLNASTGVKISSTDTDINIASMTSATSGQNANGMITTGITISEGVVLCLNSPDETVKTWSMSIVQGTTSSVTTVIQNWRSGGRMWERVSITGGTTWSAWNPYVQGIVQFNTLTASATLATNAYYFITLLNGNDILLLLPAAPITGAVYSVKNNGAFTGCTVSGNGINIQGSATPISFTSYLNLRLVYNGTQWIRLD